MFTLQFDRFVEPARKRAEIWRLIIGSITTVIIYIAGFLAPLGVIWLLSGLQSARHWANRMIDASGPAETLLLMTTFIGFALAPMIVVRLIHKRPVGTLFGRRVTVLRDFANAFLVIIALYSVMMVIWSFYFDAVPNLDFSLWVKLVPLTLIGLLIQTGAEELVFRGYLQQQLAARFRSPIVWMLIPSLIFGMLHYDSSTAGANTWLIVGSTALFGLVAADLTRITGSLGAAWGFHFANNMFAVVFVAVKGTIPGLALYTTPYLATDPYYMPRLIAVDLLMIAVVWFVLRRLLIR